MKVQVIEEKCIGCGNCVSLTDEKNIFDFNEEGRAYAKIPDISSEDKEIVETAIQYCPTSAIEKVETTDN